MVYSKENLMVLKQALPNFYYFDPQNFVQKKFLVRTDRDGFIVGPKDFDDTSSEVGLIFEEGTGGTCPGIPYPRSSLRVCRFRP